MHIPQRTCRVCRTKKAKLELTRWVKEGGQPVRDPAKQKPGKGFYTCSTDCESKLGLVIRERSKNERSGKNSRSRK